MPTGPSGPTGSETDGTDEVADLFRALGRQIKVARERAGLSQKELGDRLGYGEETISSVERARRTPQPELLVAVDAL
ncbi:helix-turn-helix transcriptional regulator, partial [Streptomyces olivaceus]|uniref:helix-turn-helix transcriptional regulator n=1 Tax=Streptomyces olivaceus TaxID=47716 RepID=UPI0012FF425C